MQRATNGDISEMDSRKPSQASDAVSTTLVACSTGSTSSSVPSAAIEVHDHILPVGWSCKADPNTRKYYFQRDSDLSHSSTSSSPTAAFGYAGSYVHSFSTRHSRVSEFAVQRITKIFPEVEEGHISYLLRIYHNREEIVIKSLLGEGCRVDGVAAVDEELFYKLRKNFSLVNPDQIRMLLAKHNNVEHETIAALLYSQSSKGFRFDCTRKPGSPRIKLRYLKLLFPSVDEEKLFDLLYNNGHNAQLVIGTLERMGYKRENTIDLRALTGDVKKGTDHSTATAGKTTARPTCIPLHFPVNASERARVTKKMKAAFPEVDDVLIDFAVECSAYDEDRATLFLTSMTPQDSDSYLPKKSDCQPHPLPSAASVSTQTGAFIDVVPSSPVLRVARVQKVEMSNCRDVATWTKEDGIIQAPLLKAVLSFKADPINRQGKTCKPLGTCKSYGPDVKNRQGKSCQIKGRDVSLRLENGELGRSVGANATLRKGPDSCLKIVRPVLEVDW